MERRFRVLATISSIYKGLGLLVLVLSISGAILLIGAGVAGMNAPRGAYVDVLGPTMLVSSLVVAFGVFIGGALTATILYGTGELIELLISLEENTRANRIHTEALAQNTGETNFLLKQVGRLLQRP